MSLGLHHIKLTLKREKKKKVISEWSLLNIPDEPTPPCRKRVKKAAHGGNSAQKRDRKATRVRLFGSDRLFIQARFLAPSLVRNRSPVPARLTYRGTFRSLPRDENWKDEREKPDKVGVVGVVGGGVGARVLLLHMAQVEGANKRLYAIGRNSRENTERVKPAALEIPSQEERPATEPLHSSFSIDVLWERTSSIR